MLSDKIEKLPVKARSSITELFLNAALSYELGGIGKDASDLPEVGL